MQKETMWMVVVDCNRPADTDDGERLIQQMDRQKVVGLARDYKTAKDLAAEQAECDHLHYEWEECETTLENLINGICGLYRNDLGMIIEALRIPVGERVGWL